MVGYGGAAVVRCPPTGSLFGGSVVYLCELIGTHGSLLIHVDVGHYSRLVISDLEVSFPLVLFGERVLV